MPSTQYLPHNIDEIRTVKDDINAVYNIPPAGIDQHWWLDPTRARRRFEHDGDYLRPLDPLKVKSKGVADLPFFLCQRKNYRLVESLIVLK